MVAHRLEILRPGLQAAALGLDVERAPDGGAKLLPRDRPGRRRGGLRRVPSGEGQAEETASVSTDMAVALALPCSE